MSPSRVESAEACPLKWALESAGGTRESGAAQRIGNLLHEIAAELPHGSVEDFERALDARWAEIGSLDTWRRQARARCAPPAWSSGSRPYVAGVDADEVRTEEPFRVEIGRAILQGRADRLHVTGDSAAVVDLKTGAQRGEAADAHENAQLEMYQLAAGRGSSTASRRGGAELVYVGVDAVKAAVRRQPAVDPDRAAGAPRRRGRDDGGGLLRGAGGSAVRPLPRAEVVPGAARGRGGGAP